MRALHIMHICGVRCGGGAAAAATRLHLDMLKKGVDSRIACVWGEEAGLEQVVVLRTWWWWLGVRILHAVTRRWLHLLDLPGLDRLVHDFKPDEIHVHWIKHDTISWRQLERLRLKVEVDSGVTSPALYVHLHDLWALEQKRIVALNPTFVGYSDYVVNEVRKRGCQVERRNLILDPVFSAPESIKLGKEGQTFFAKFKAILFGCNNGRKNPDKGFADLVAALELLPKELKDTIELRIFGEEPDRDGEAEMTAGVRTVLLGRISDPMRLRDEYRSAACFAFPSTSETMGMTKLEALACECPVIAFDRTACAEGIEHLKTGYVAKDVADYARGLAWGVGANWRGVSDTSRQLFQHRGILIY